MSIVDRQDVAARILALRLSKKTLCLALGTSVETLARLVCVRDATERTYRRILPRLAELEKQVAAYRKKADADAAALFNLLNEHADEVATHGAKRVSP